MKRTLRHLLFLLAVIFPVWLFFLSNVFTMGYYTPLPRKLAITAVAIVLPVALGILRTRNSIRFAVLVVLLTWVPIGLLWALDKKPYSL